MTQNRMTDESNDKKYFVMTPQIVWAVSRDPYDFTLWNTIKIITGEKGECYLSTEDLAALAMMSAGKVSECRKYLIDQGVLEGKVRQDPGYPQPVWHLTIPDLWEANIEWRKQYDSLKDRIELKREQRKQLKSGRIAKKLAEHNKLHQVKPSPGEDGLPPGETKKNQQEKQKSITCAEPDAQLFSELVSLLKMPKELMTPKMQRAYDDFILDLQELGAKPGDIDVFGRRWYEKDWRGQKEQKPTLEQVRSEWGNLMNSQQNGANGKVTQNEDGSYYL